MFSVRNFTEICVPHKRWESIYKKKLARHKKKLEISVVLVGEVRMRGIASKYYKKKTATVLTFKYDKFQGEIVLNVEAARMEFKKTRISITKILTSWFVHGLSRIS